MTVIKEGKDSLVVNKVELRFTVVDSPPRKEELVCNGFKLEGECGKNGKFCTRKLQNCRRKFGGGNNNNRGNNSNKNNSGNSNNNRGNNNNSNNNNSGGILNG